jgi:hypothetical protein
MPRIIVGVVSLLLLAGCAGGEPQSSSDVVGQTPAQTTPIADIEGFISAWEDAIGVSLDGRDELATSLVDAGLDVCWELETGATQAELVGAIRDSTDYPEALIRASVDYLCPDLESTIASP